MNDQTDPTPFGPTVPGPAALPPPPDLFAAQASEAFDPAEPGEVGEEEYASSPVAVVDEPRQPHQLGNDWSFAGAGGGPSISLPRSRRSIALALAVLLVAAAG